MEKHLKALEFRVRFFSEAGWELLICPTPVIEGLEQGMVSGLVCAPGDEP